MCDQRQKGTTAVYFAPACPIRRRLPKGVFGCCTSPPTHLGGRAFVLAPSFLGCVGWWVTSRPPNFLPFPGLAAVSAHRATRF